jgi:lipopolysaccharide transport system permease protein
VGCDARGTRDDSGDLNVTARGVNRIGEREARPDAASPKPRSASPWAVVWKKRNLLLRSVRTELSTRYAGSLLGVGWIVLTPALLLGVYGVVYLEVFKVRGPSMSSSQFILYIFAGLVPYLVTAEAIGASVGSVTSNTSMLSNSVYPMDLLPARAVLSAQPVMLVGLVVIVVGDIFVGSLSWTIVLVPIIWALQIIGLIGLAWLLALFHVVFRDLQNLIAVLLMVLLVASPIAYTPETVPDSARLLLYLNPFAYFVIAYQRTLVTGELPTLFESVMLVGCALGIFALGNRAFRGGRAFVTDNV